MSAVIPNLVYNITINGRLYDALTHAFIPITEVVELGSTVCASISTRSSYYNTLTVSFTSDISLSRLECRVTDMRLDYDIDLGQSVYVGTNIPANTQRVFLIPVNTTNFNAGDITYRVSLYALNAVDHTWDVSYFLLTNLNELVVDSEGNIIEVVTQRALVADKNLCRILCPGDIIIPITYKVNDTWATWIDSDYYDNTTGLVLVVRNNVTYLEFTNGKSLELHSIILLPSSKLSANLLYLYSS